MSLKVRLHHVMIRLVFNFKVVQGYRPACSFTWFGLEPVCVVFQILQKQPHRSSVR